MTVVIPGVKPRKLSKCMAGTLEKRSAGKPPVPFFRKTAQAFLLFQSLLPSLSHMPIPVAAQMMEKTGTMKMNQQ